MLLNLWSVFPFMGPAVDLQVRLQNKAVMCYPAAKGQFPLFIFKYTYLWVLSLRDSALQSLQRIIPAKQVQPRSNTSLTTLTLLPAI